VEKLCSSIIIIFANFISFVESITADRNRYTALISDINFQTGEEKSSIARPHLR
jgi:hypothetical protein